jgi:hypothetical protein
MWPWIKRWRDWAMNDLWSMHRISPQPQALHYSYEKAGLTIHEQPIPWNAEVVLVEALLRTASAAARRKADYALHIPGQAPIPAESFRRQEAEDRYRLFFRVSTPSRTCTAEVMWRNKRLGQITLPILSRDDFLSHLRLQMPTLFVRLADHSVACQTFVSSQCKGLSATALLTSPTSLVPLLDLGLQVEFRSERGGGIRTVPAQFTSSQLAERQALVSIVPRGFPKRIGTWSATWILADRPLATQRIRAISQRAFHRSLRVSDTRFVFQPVKGKVGVSRQLPPLEELERAGPCFLVSSAEQGMAGLCHLEVRVQVAGVERPPVVLEQEVLITDGPTVFAPGTLDVADLSQVSAFELQFKGNTLGTLSTSPIPIASFSGEGGFKPAPEYAWTTAADEELNERLTKLLEERGTFK